MSAGVWGWGGGWGGGVDTKGGTGRGRQRDRDREGGWEMASKTLGEESELQSGSGAQRDAAGIDRETE